MFDQLKTPFMDIVNLPTHNGGFLSVRVSHPIDYEPLPEILSFLFQRLNATIDKLPAIRMVDKWTLQDIIGAAAAGVFFPDVEEVWINANDKQDSGELWQQSVVVHELVHAVQKQQGRLHSADPEQFIQNEIEAFGIQREWLISKGSAHSLTQNTPKQLEARIRCTYAREATLNAAYYAERQREDARACREPKPIAGDSIPFVPSTQSQGTSASEQQQGRGLHTAAFFLYAVDGM